MTNAYPLIAPWHISTGFFLFHPSIRRPRKESHQGTDRVYVFGTLNCALLETNVLLIANPKSRLNEQLNKWYLNFKSTHVSMD